MTLWRSFAAFDGRCSVRTWVYRVANNVAATHAFREERDRKRLVALDTIDDIPDANDATDTLEAETTLQRLTALIHRLKSPDREVMTLYLEGLSADGIGEVTGLSPGAIATRISRLKSLLARMFHEVTP